MHEKFLNGQATNVLLLGTAEKKNSLYMKDFDLQEKPREILEFCQSGKVETLSPVKSWWFTLFKNSGL